MATGDFKCPECGGTGRLYHPDAGRALIDGACGGTGRVADRRAPTASDRAVEKINLFIGPNTQQCQSDWERGAKVALNEIKRIIEQEAANVRF